MTRRPEVTSTLKEKLEGKSQEKKNQDEARYQFQDKVPDRLAQRGRHWPFGSHLSAKGNL